MSNDELNDVQKSRLAAISRWDNEGGATLASAATEPQLSNAELIQLRIRVIALENLVIALLAEGSLEQVGQAHDIAAVIAPHPGTTHHPLTVNAAAHMLDLLHRSEHLKGRFTSPQFSLRPDQP